jgi:ESCRT-II complex subunit VPS22
MRRKVGVSVVKGKQDEKDKFSKMGKSLEDLKMTFVRDTLTTFQTSLSEFASKHKDRINSDPEFRQQFHKMCLSVGVDPLASSKGFWADMLGVGDYYFELGVKIIQATVQTRAANGGIMVLEELLRNLNEKQIQQEQQRRRQKTASSPVSTLTEDDIIRAIEKISVLGNGFRILRVGGKRMVCSVPLEINTDHEAIMTAAEQEDGGVTEEMIVSMYGWSHERFTVIMKPLLLEGMVWVDIHNGT